MFAVFFFCFFFGGGGGISVMPHTIRLTHDMLLISYDLQDGE